MGDYARTVKSTVGRARGFAFAICSFVLGAGCVYGDQTAPDEQEGPVAGVLIQNLLPGCTTASYPEHDYLVCDVERTWAQAQSDCRSQGMELAHIDTQAENDFVRQRLAAVTHDDGWIGANDSSVEGTWRWSDDNVQFWNGGSNGSSVAGRYARWGTGEPGAQDCARMDDSSGRWEDRSCTENNEFVCERTIDLCPLDPNKGAPGVCGCGVPDLDTDADGTFDCQDTCPLDSARTAPGLCGCVGETNLRPAGTACSDAPCPASQTCDSAGNCGSLTACKPTADCTVELHEGRAYAFCDVERSWSQAQTLCRSKGMELVRIDDLAENTFVQQRLNAITDDDGWIGATDSATEDAWLWSDNSQQFWTGGSNGSAVSGRFSRWATGEPGSQDCARMEDESGRWSDQDCSSTNEFVCEVIDKCPSDPAKYQPGICGCGVADTDRDRDGTPDCADQCPDDPARVAPGPEGCADTLDQQSIELTALKRLAADPGTPPSNMPTSMMLKQSSGQAIKEAWRVIDSMPDDSTLHSEDDLRPYIVALARAWSAITLIKTEPLGRLPGGLRCSDTLEGTNADPTRPLISQLFRHLAYQDDDEELTRAVYVLSDLQNLIHCSNRTDLVRLDRGLSSAFEAVTQRLVTQHKTVLAVAFHDHALPVALLLYDAGRAFYTPRAYRMLAAPLDFKPRFEASEPSDPATSESMYFALPDSPVMPAVPFGTTVGSYLYCDRPASHYTLSRFGIWLPDQLQGGRLSRVRLGGTSICDFLSRITDFSRMGAGDCSLLQLAYSGYQCRSPRTCNIAAPDLYQLGSRPGSSLSPFTHFGVPKTFARQVNCESPGTNDGLGGYGSQRPGTDCLITGDDLIARAQNPFLQCLIASQAGGPVEPPPEPWNDECSAIDCAEGEQCEPEPPPEEEQPEQTTDPTDVDSDGDTDEDDRQCNGQCEANGLMSQKAEKFVDAMEKTFGPAHCPGCLVDGWQAVVADILSHPPAYVVNEHVNLNPGGYTGSSLKLGNTSPDGKTVSLDNTAIEQIAYDRAAKYHNLSTGACRVNAECAADALNKEYPAVRREALLHELGHVVFQEAIRGARTDVFSREAQSTIGYLGLFNWQWEDLFPKGTCSEDPAACSAVHDYIRHLLGGFNTKRSGRSCGVEGACSEGCGANGVTKYQACDALADLIRTQYRNRIAPVCPPPAPNQLSIAAECRFPGCFGDGIQTTRSACPFALCTGTAQLGANIACDCCSMCDPAPIITGYSPSCRDEPSCEECCRWCNTGPAAQCPPTFAPTVLEAPPAWQQSGSPD